MRLAPVCRDRQRVRSEECLHTLLVCPTQQAGSRRCYAASWKLAGRLFGACPRCGRGRVAVLLTVFRAPHRETSLAARRKAVAVRGKSLASRRIFFEYTGKSLGARGTFFGVSKNTRKVLWRRGGSSEGVVAEGAYRVLGRRQLEKVKARLILGFALHGYATRE